MDNGQQLGELVYKNILFLTAEIRLLHSERYTLEPNGFFGTSITVTKNRTNVATLAMNWRGQIVLSFDDGRTYVFKAKGMFRSTFFIENEDEEKLIQLNPQFNWKKFIYHYDISCDQQPQDHLLVMLGVYAANYYLMCMSGA